MLNVEMLGHFAITAPAGEVVLPTAKVRLLAAYLFWKQGRWVSRDFLCEMLWREAEQNRAAASLRTALYGLRHAMDEQGGLGCFIELRREAVRVPGTAGCLVDAREFEEKARLGLTVKTGQLDVLMAAVGLYRGDFLEGMDADWCLGERRRLADLHLAVLRALVERLWSAGLQSAALTYARRWVETDCLDEAAHQWLMRLYCAMGQPALALEQFERCRQALRVELGLAPSEATLRLYRELGLGAASPGENPSSATRARGLPARRLVAKPALPWKKVFSTDPVRNARFLLASAEALALESEGLQGVKSLEKALTAFDRLGHLGAKARLILGEALLWLSVPLAPSIGPALRDQGFDYIQEALAYYRSCGPPAELQNALYMAAAACWMKALNHEGAALAAEGLTLIRSLGEREAEGRLGLALGVTLREAYRLDEAEAAFAQALEAVPYMSNLREIQWLVFQRGILSYITGDLAELERFLNEALSLTQLIRFPSLMVKVGECMIRSMLIVCHHYQGRTEELRELLPPPDLERFNPEPFVYLNSLLVFPNERRSILRELGKWLRARLDKLPPPMVGCTVRVVVEELLVDGQRAEAARWAGAGVRLARRYQWGGFQAFYYCFRAVALIRQGRLEPAEVCLRRAEKLAHPSDRWTPAWLARATGLLARSRGEAKAAARALARSRRLFLEIGDRYHARQVEFELSREGEGVTSVALPANQTD
ncbi:MAG: BTAD domain-containing putative transcriptional regulator [Bacillota bacterium]|nr:BTAD domain-containing putative transcriptional regulator [Bacillota bacterium]